MPFSPLRAMLSRLRVHATILLMLMRAAMIRCRHATDTLMPYAAADVTPFIYRRLFAAISPCAAADMLLYAGARCCRLMPPLRRHVICRAHVASAMMPRAAR